IGSITRTTRDIDCLLMLRVVLSRLQTFWNLERHDSLCSGTRFLKAAGTRTSASSDAVNLSVDNLTNKRYLKTQHYFASRRRPVNFSRVNNLVFST
ncbi:MAG: hypothetical protein M3R15_15605, partial [Acidobacteriota bacterium]|nr:hypothetical protein [Acidobacteriota bacterium]